MKQIGTYAAAIVYGGSNVINGIARKGSDLGGFHAPSYFDAYWKGTWSGVDRTIRDPNFYTESLKGYLSSKIIKNDYYNSKKISFVTDYDTTVVLGGAYIIHTWDEKVETWEKNFKEPLLAVPNLSEFYEYPNPNHLTKESDINSVKDYLRSIGILIPEDF